MTFFIFAGDMLVMLFMVVLVIWVFLVSPNDEIDKTARIPLEDEVYEPGDEPEDVVNRQAGEPHG